MEERILQLERQVEFLWLIVAFALVALCFALVVLYRFASDHQREKRRSEELAARVMYLLRPDDAKALVILVPLTAQDRRPEVGDILVCRGPEGKQVQCTAIDWDAWGWKALLSTETGWASYTEGTDWVYLQRKDKGEITRFVPAGKEVS